MTSSPALSGYYPKSYDWNQSHEHREGHDGLDRSSPSKDSNSSPPTRRTGSGVQRISFSPSPLVMSTQANAEYMKTNPKSAAPLEPYVRDGSEDNYNNLRRAGNRWSFNGSEKTIDSKLGGWDLVDEIGKLSIANGSAGEGTDGTTTPSKNGVLQIHEASPLETSSSDTSLDSASPQNPDALNLPSHSRGSSTDTLNSESSAPSNAAQLNSLKAAVVMSDLTKDRPRSFSGALSDVELRRLQNIHTPSQLPESLQDRGSPLTREVSGGENKPPSSVPSGENIGGSVQPMYPSLTAYPGVQQQPQFMGANVQGLNQGEITGGRHEELHHRQQFVNGNQNVAAPGSFVPIQTNGLRGGQPDVIPQYRQQVRGMSIFQPPVQMQAQAPPPLLPSPTNFGYPPGMANAPGHQNAMSLGTSQQMYNMLLPMDPGMNRTQQVFRAGHQHSASDPASLRDAAALLLGAGVHNLQGMQFPPTAGMTPGMYPPMAMTPPVFASQFFPPGAGPQPQDMYSQQDMMNAMARQIPQFTGSTGVPSTPQANTSTFAGSPSPPNSSGPSANNRKLGLYKTELCRSWEEKGSCRYGPKCQFAHGEEEIRKVARHPKYKTEICRTFWVSGSCPYGKRCCFIHTELPASGTPPGAVEGAAVPPPSHDGRARSMSTNSDPNDAQNSLLARITAKRKVEENGATTPTVATAIENGNGTGYQYAHKPPSGALRVDTNVEAPVTSKQNKSAYPTFASSSLQALSPGPVTAGPEFGHRLGTAGVGIADSINQRISGASNPNSRHAYTASEASITFGQQARNVSGGSTPFGILGGQTDSPGPSNTPSGHGHSRSGSASNWGSFSQKNAHLGASSSPYAHTPSPGNEPMTASAASVVLPWATNELNANSRHSDRTWS